MTHLILLPLFAYLAGITLTGAVSQYSALSQRWRGERALYPRARPYAPHWPLVGAPR